jgi:microcystin degradation protein MlrC
MPSRTWRVAIGSIFAESSHFLTTRIDRFYFENTYIYERNDLFKLAGTDCEIAGALTICERENATVVPLVAARSVSGGPATDDCYAELKQLLLTPLQQALPVDGVILPLHGAMTTLSDDDPEGDLIHAVRQIVGKSVPIIVTLDLHAHVTQKMVEFSDAIIGFTHYPHDDTFTTGERSANLMFKILRGEAHPVMAMAKVPVICSGINGMTFGDAPMAHLTRRARELENDPSILSVSIFHVQPSIDIPGMGSGGLVIADGDLERAESEACKLAEEYWARRQDFEPEIIPVAEAVQRGREIDGGPVLLVDTADCVGGGAAGDSVALLQKLLELEVTEPTFLMVIDPEAALRCAEAGIGQKILLELGYKIDPSWGESIQVEGRVRHLLDGKFRYRGGIYGGTIGDMGLCAVFQVGAMQILMMSRPTYDWLDEQFRAAGLDARDAKFIGVKNPMNYNFAYRDLAKAAFVVDTPGPTPPTLRHMPFKRLARPFFPVDKDIPGLEPTILKSSG